MLTSRERVEMTLRHEEPDRVPLDLGGSLVTGIHVIAVYRLRQLLGLDPPGTPVKVIEPYQMLGEVTPDLVDALGVDVLPLMAPTTFFGFKNEGWKPWELFDGTPVLVPGAFNTDPEPDGSVLQYPQGDKSAPPSGRMPPDKGYYFDVIIREPPSLDRDSLSVEDNLQEFIPLSDEELDYFGQEAERLYAETDKAILALFGGTDFGNSAPVAVPGIRYPRGLRDPVEWWMSVVTRPDFVYEVFDRQCEIGLANLERLYQVVGDRVTAILVTANDFGMQTGPLISPRAYRELYLPFHKRINDWVHEHTTWKTFTHSCGSVTAFIEDFIAAGFDILNPVQTSAKDMDPADLKRRFGDRITFWGGGVDTQHTLPFGTPDEVRRQVRERMRVFGAGGGFVFHTIHNLQPVPDENLLALFEAVQAYRNNPLS